MTAFSFPRQKTLPTMYDLPSENPEEPGLPDEFHDAEQWLKDAVTRLLARGMTVEEAAEILGLPVEMETTLTINGEFVRAIADNCDILIGIYQAARVR